jgi:SNF2 family DNA or RNA helicase
MKVCASSRITLGGKLSPQIAHHIRNRRSQTFIAACSVRSSFRWCLTGTPVHNSLDDYGALLSFLSVPGFTEKTTFDHWITKPIQEKKQEGFSRLQILVRTTCLRRTKESIGDTLNLPQRKEEIEFVKLHQQDQELYDFFKSKATHLVSGTTTSNQAAATLKSAQDGSVLALLNFLRLICDHGQQILPETALQIWNDRGRSMADRDETMVDGDDGGAHVFSAKVLALLKNLISTHTPTYDIKGRYVLVKR